VNRRASLERIATTVVLVLAWGSTFASVKIGLEAAPPLVFAGLRALVGAVILVPVALVRDGRPRVRVTWGWHLLLGLTNIAGFFALQTLALLALPSGLTAVLIYLQPVLVGLLAWRFLGESMRPTKAVGLLLGFGGIVVVSAGAISGDLSTAGVLEAVGAALAWATGTVAFKPAVPRLGAWWAVAGAFSVGAVVLLAIGLPLEGWQITWSWRFAAAFWYTGLIGTTLAWVLWLRLLISGEASKVATYIFFVPLVSVTIGALFLGERVGVALAIGAALVAAGVYLVNRPARAGRVRS
jgi:O-acetylserine/cysteine efflux transporter